MRLFDVLSEKNAMDVLVILFEHGDGKNRTEISKIGDLNKNTVNKRVKELVNAGLLKEEVSKAFPYETRLYLTDLGRAVSKILKELKELEKRQV